ncbi:MAG: MotA/TolQ/ExbB proton channel family protein [Kiritimatiellae bacterium]|nr:MotA/TolQ/ExbB proton channel family protein [Kiritimatiellia bacterium]
MIELLSQGGSVLWIIVVCGLVALVVFIERSLHLHRARIRFEDFLKGIFNILRRRNIEEALAICEETPGPVAYIVRIAILHRSADREEMRTAIQDAGAAEISRLERRLVVVATVAQIAPLLGLLGTVLGLVSCLLGLYTSAPLVQSADIFGGVMRALLTTGAGLMVAIPCYVAFNLLVLKIDRLVLDMEMASSEIVSFLQDQRNGDGANA